jgi:ribonuclease Z
LFEIVFLGTSASAPSVQRGLSAHVVKHNEFRFLVDCGEGTQRQILQSGLGFKRLNRVLITHGHLDHILGLAGLFSTFARWETLDEIEIAGGKWALERIHALLYGVRVIPMGGKNQVKVTVTAFPVSHRGPDCFGFLFEEKSRRPFLAEKADALGVPHGPQRRDLVRGKPITLADGKTVKPEEVLGKEEAGTKYVHVGDTGRTDNIMEHCQNADALVIEATYLQEESEMAREFAHLTAAQAAQLAKDANVKHLILTHLSRRYPERAVREEAQAVFPNAIVARDFDAYQIRRGECVKVES